MDRSPGLTVGDGIAVLGLGYGIHQASETQDLTDFEAIVALVLYGGPPLWAGAHVSRIIRGVYTAFEKKENMDKRTGEGES